MTGEAGVFTMRLWFHRGAFRAAVRLAGDETAESPQALAAYFERALRACDAAPCPLPEPPPPPRRR
jgi:hypothetical protein